MPRSHRLQGPLVCPFLSLSFVILSMSEVPLHLATSLKNCSQILFGGHCGKAQAGIMEKFEMSARPAVLGLGVIGSSCVPVTMRKGF